MEYDAVLSAVRLSTIQRNLLHRSPAMRLQAAISSESLVDAYIGRHISEVRNIHSDGSDNLRYHT